MLSISQNEQNFFCIEWIPTEFGPSVLQYKKISFSKSENNYKNFLDNILTNISIDSQNNSKTLALSLDINNIGITSFKYDSQTQLDEYRIWYEDKILGSYIKENFDIYYYPMNNSENTVMVIYVSKLIKKNILKSCAKYKYRLLHLSVDIFSANFSTQIFGSKSFNNYVIWKILKNNYHILTYYEKGAFKHIIKFQKSNSLKIIFSIGDKKNNMKLEELSYSLLFNSEKNNNIEGFGQIFIYQNKSNSTQIDQIKKNNPKKIKIMDIGSSFFKKNTNKVRYNLLSYNENGNSLRGIDV